MSDASGLGKVDYGRSKLVIRMNLTANTIQELTLLLSIQSLLLTSLYASTLLTNASSMLSTIRGGDSEISIPKSMITMVSLYLSSIFPIYELGLNDVSTHSQVLSSCLPQLLFVCVLCPNSTIRSQRLSSLLVDLLVGRLSSSTAYLKSLDSCEL